MMHINPDEFLKHINDGGNVAYFKGAPKFNLADREKGKITVHVSGERNDDYGAAVQDTIAILQASHDAYMAVMFAGSDACLIKPINNIENLYLYVDSEKHSVGFKDNAYAVTMSFIGTKGFVKFITGLTGKCIEITYSENYIEDRDDASMYPSTMVTMDAFVNHPSEKFQKEFQNKIEHLSHGSDYPGRYLESRKCFVKKKEDLLIKGALRYKTKKFRRIEDLVKFLNRREIAKEDIIDIQHKWFSHVLIYCYKKEV